MRPQAALLPMSSAGMIRLAGIWAVIALLSSGCLFHPQRPGPPSASAVEECREGSPSALHLAAMTIALPAAVHDASDGPVLELGTLERRIVLSVEPENLGPDDRMTWSRLSIRSFGGTFSGATRLVTDYSSLELSPSSQPLVAHKGGRRQEIVSVETSPGEIVVTRTALRRASLFGTVVLDLAVTPGGVPVDETLVRIPRLWTDARKAVAPREVDIQLVPVRHPPGISGVDAIVTLQYSLHRGRARVEWRCTADATVPLASNEDARPPLWDLGVSELNESRTTWLALYDARLGPLRAIFDTPQAATAFANWGRATRATKVGRFSIGLFTATEDVPLRPTVPVDSSIARTLRPITPEDWETMRVGRLGEP